MPSPTPRSPVKLMVVCKILDTKKVFRALTRDMGGDGISFISEYPLTQGQQLEIELTLSDRPTPIPFTGQVRWCQAASEEKDSPGQLVDVTFATIDPKQLVLIKQFVALNAVPPSE